MSSPVLLVARREIVTRLRQRSFQVITALSIAGVIAFIVFAGIKGGEVRKYDVAVTPEVSAALRTQIEGIADVLNSTVKLEEVADRQAATQAVHSERADIALIGTAEVILNRGVPEQDISPRGRFVIAVSEAVRLHAGLAAQGLDPKAASAALNAPPPEVTALEPAPPQTRGRVATQVGLVLIYLMIIQHPMSILTSISREKGTRLVELLLATLRPSQLLGGKLIGMGALALGHAALLGIAALTAGFAVGRETTAAFNFDVVTVGWLLIWILVGLGLYFALYAVAGSMVGRDESTPTSPVFMIVLAAYFAANITITGGDVAWYAPILAFIPFTAPFMVPALLGLEAMPVWQALLSLGISAASIPLVVWGASSVYSAAVVRTGQKTRWSEVLRPWRLKRPPA